MRDFKGMKRQRGRGRGGGGGKPQQNANRAFDSNGPEGVKVRGNAQTVFEKYQQLARDAASSGDRVLAENYLQHAEHYFRLLRAIQPQRPAAEILGRDQFASGFDIDFEDEGGGQTVQAEAGEEPAQDGDGESEGRWQGRDDRPRDDRRERFEGRDRDRDFRDRDGRDRDRDGGRRDRDDRNRGQERGERSDERPRDRDRFERREERPEREPPAAAEPQPQGGDERVSPMLRDAEGGESQAPAFLQAPAAMGRPEGGEDEGANRRPRRRRAPRSFEAGEGTDDGEAA
jgi:hypothetical protein